MLKQTVKNYVVINLTYKVNEKLIKISEGPNIAQLSASDFKCMFIPNKKN